MKVKSIIECIGKTPCLKLCRLFPESSNIWLKLEHLNPGGSIKDRVALAMIHDAEQSGVLKKGGTIIEPTSGNTGIGLAMVAAVKGYRLILVMPNNMSVERRKIIRAYGADLELTPSKQGMKGAIERAAELANTIPGAWMPMQFENDTNPRIHQQTTAIEILEDFPDGIDVMVGGVGTGGHLSGVGKILKEQFPAMKIIAVEPLFSAVISGEKAGKHKIQGLGAGFIPRNLDIDIIDQVMKVSDENAIQMKKILASKEGLFVGISTGAVVWAINEWLKNKKLNQTIVGFAYDRGDRYL